MPATTTRLILSAATGQWYLESTDPATPNARILEDGEDKPLRALCPECEALIPLQERTVNGITTGIEYQLHFYDEHTRPAIRYEETADDPWDGIEGSDSRFRATGSTR